MMTPEQSPSSRRVGGSSPPRGAPRVPEGRSGTPPDPDDCHFRLSRATYGRGVGGSAWSVPLRGS